MTDYHGMRIDIVPRRLNGGGLCYDVTVLDGFLRPLWSYQTTTPENGLRAARAWIDGTDRSVGFEQKM